MTLLLILLLAQANDFVIFEICRVDYSATPPEARHARGEQPINIRRGAVAGYQAIPEHFAGIDCVKISDGARSVFVVGSGDEVAAKLRGRP